MLSVQGQAQDPNSILAFIVVLAIAVIIWWRIALVLIAIALMVLLGLGAITLFHDMHLAIR
jgi:ABC-type multidrug transport system fused ATPase/permease subunit